MKINKLVFVSLFSFVFFVGYAQNSEKQITIKKAIETTNIQALSNHLNNTVEIVILDKENVYGKAQASKVLVDFLSKHPPKKFVQQHKGTTAGAEYVIGELQCEKESYRVYILRKNVDGKKLIHVFRIENN